MPLHLQFRITKTGWILLLDSDSHEKTLAILDRLEDASLNLQFLLYVTILQHGGYLHL